MGDEEGGAFPEIGAVSAGRQKGNLDANKAGDALDDRRIGSSISLPLTQLIREAKTIEKNAFAPQIPSFDFHASPSMPEQPFEQMEFNTAFAIAMRMEGASKKRGSIISTAPPVKEDGGIEQELKVFGKIPAKDAGSEIGMSLQQASQYLPQKKQGAFSLFLQKLKFTKKKKPNIAPPPFTPLAPASKAQLHGTPQPTSWQPSAPIPPAQKIPAVSPSEQKPYLQDENSRQEKKKNLFGIFGAKKTPPPQQPQKKEGLSVSSGQPILPPMPQGGSAGKPAEEGQTKSSFSQTATSRPPAQEKPGMPPILPGIYSDKHYPPTAVQIPKPSQKIKKELENAGPKQKAKASLFGGLGTPSKRPLPAIKQDAGDDGDDSDDGGMREYDEFEAEKTQNAGFQSPLITPKPKGSKIYPPSQASQIPGGDEGAGVREMRDADIEETGGGNEGEGAPSPHTPQKNAQEKKKNGAQDFGFSALSNALKSATGARQEKNKISTKPQNAAQLQKIPPRPRLIGYETPSGTSSISPTEEIETHYIIQKGASSLPEKKPQTPPARPQMPKEGAQEKSSFAKKGETLKFSQKEKLPLQKQKTNAAQAGEKETKILAARQPKTPAQKAKIPSPAKEAGGQEDGGASSLDELEQAAGELEGGGRRKSLSFRQKAAQPSNLASRLGVLPASQKKPAEAGGRAAKKIAQTNEEEEIFAPAFARKKIQRPAQQEDEGEAEGGDEGEGAPAIKQIRRRAQQEDEEEGDEGGGAGGAHAVSSRVSQKADDLLSAPQKEKEKEEAGKNDDILFAYAKERHKWVFEIYKMGGMTLEEFRSKMNEKMSQDGSEANGEKEGAGEKGNLAFSNLDAAANKKFKK